MMPLGLTPEQVAARRLGIGGSDARIIAEGTDEERYHLWQVKRGLIEPPQILKPWDAAVRHTLEPLILDWYERETGRPLTRRGESVVAPGYPMIRCLLDGYDAELRKPIDAKALNLYTPDAWEWCVSHYRWQIVHQMICCDAEAGALHVSLGMKEPRAVEIAYDEWAAAEYIGRCREFWGYVESGKEPPGAPPLPPPAQKIEYRTVSMEGNNRWSMYAADWLASGQAAKLFDASVKGIKAMIENDVGEASGHGIIVKRDKRGLAIKEMK